MHKIENFEIEMKAFGCKRKVWVYLPDGYDPKGEPFPVIYMQDGQNLFYKELTLYGDVWHADRAMDRVQKNTGRAAIVVGVENSVDRITEYAPWKGAKEYGVLQSMGGRGSEYAEFFATELKKEVDKRYNTVRGREGTAVIGSSAGGMISTYIGLRYQDVYETMGLFSTAVSFNGEEFRRFVKETPQKAPQHALVYVGGKEDIAVLFTAEQMVDDSVWLYKELASRGVKTELIVNSEFLHNEYAWSVYFNKFAEDFVTRYYEGKE